MNPVGPDDPEAIDIGRPHDKVEQGFSTDDKRPFATARCRLPASESFSEATAKAGVATFDALIEAGITNVVGKASKTRNTCIGENLTGGSTDSGPAPGRGSESDRRWPLADAAAPQTAEADVNRSLLLWSTF
jgi:hypothetical protein